MTGVKKTSSGRRLLEVVERLRTCDLSGSVARGWATAAGADANDTSAALRAVADAILLVQQVKNDVQTIPGVKQELYLRALNRLESAIANQNPNAQLQNLISNIDAAVIYGLEFCADQLDLVSHESLLPEGALDSLRAQIEGVLESILDSELDPRFKALLVARLEDIKRAILAYRLFGLEPLNKALDSALGALLTGQDHTRKSSARERIKDIFAIIVSAQTAVRHSMDLGNALPEAVVKLLNPGTSA